MEKERNNVYKIASILILLGVLITTFIYIKNHMYLRLNSDDSSELMLAKLLADENALLTKNWYYSTELKVFNTNLIYPLIFRLTDNFLTVRMVSYLIIWAILLVVYLLLCKVLNIKRNAIISASLLFVAFSDQYYAYVLSTSHYLPFIIISFLTIALLELYLDKKKTIYLILSTILALLAGLGGPRQIVVTYLPLFITSALIFYFNKGKDFPLLKFSTLNLLCSGIGYIINIKVLFYIFSYQSYGGIHFANFNVDRIWTIIRGVITTFGFKDGYVFSFTLIVNAIAVIWIVLTIWAIYYGIKNRNGVDAKYSCYASFVLTAYITFILVYVFTDMGYADRYLLPVTILSIPLIVLFFQESEINVLNDKKDILSCLFILMVIVQGTSNLYDISKEDINTERRTIIKTLQEEGYTNGYASFWNGNVLTELTNGDIEVWAFRDQDLNTIDSFDMLFEWLQLKEHFVTKPSGKVFVLFTIEQYNNTPLNKYLDLDKVIYQSDNYILFGYENYEEIGA